MDVNIVTDIITNVGFPIACVIALGYFAFYIVNKKSADYKSSRKSFLETIFR